MKFNVSVFGFCIAALLTACGGGDPYDAGAHKVKYVAQASTFVGNSAGGASTDGTGSDVRFTNPNAVALAGNGNLYVGDKNLIRTVAPGGLVTTLMTLPADMLINGLVVDAAGDIFASTFVGKIFKISTANTPSFTIFSGGAGAGFNDSSAANATFHTPKGMAIDGAGNLYIADCDNHAIRKITKAGDVSTVAGSGSEGHADDQGTSASFKNPSGIAVDADGNLYVTDTGNHLIRKISANGNVTTLAGSGASGSVDGTGAVASFNLPQGIAIDSKGNLIVTDTGNNSIRTVTPQGVVTTLAGNGDGNGYSGLKNGVGGNAQFNYPIGIAIGPDGTIYIADTSNFQIRLLKMIWI